MADNTLPLRLGRNPVGSVSLPVNVAGPDTFTCTFCGGRVLGTRIQEGDRLTVEPNVTPRVSDIVVIRDGGTLDVRRFSEASAARVVGVVTFGIYAVREGGE